MMALEWLFIILTVVHCTVTKGITTKNGVEEFPYHADLILYDSISMTGWPGSGVLVSSKHILTTGTNVNRYSKWEIGLGGQRKTDLLRLTSTVGFVHPTFIEALAANNIGIIVLPKKIQFTDRISPISLPAQGSKVPIPQQSGMVTTFHFKSFDGKEFKSGRHNVISDENCLKSYPHLKTIQEEYFCTNEVGFTVCGGTQGAGFVLGEGKWRYLGGLVSFGNFWASCMSTEPIALIRVSLYTDWIKNSIRD